MGDMGITSNEGARAAGWNIVVPFPGEVVGKAKFEDINLRIMKSTKRFKVPGGWIYNSTTEFHKGGRVSVAEALAFVPEATIKSTNGEVFKEK